MVLTLRFSRPRALRGLGVHRWNHQSFSSTINYQSSAIRNQPCKPQSKFTLLHSIDFPLKIKSAFWINWLHGNAGWRHPRRKLRGHGWSGFCKLSVVAQFGHSHRSEFLSLSAVPPTQLVDSFFDFLIMFGIVVEILFWKFLLAIFKKRWFFKYQGW